MKSSSLSKNQYSFMRNLVPVTRSTRKQEGQKVRGANVRRGVTPFVGAGGPAPEVSRGVVVGVGTSLISLWNLRDHRVGVGPMIQRLPRVGRAMYSDRIYRTASPRPVCLLPSGPRALNRVPQISDLPLRVEVSPQRKEYNTCLLAIRHPVWISRLVRPR